ncbi:MAG: hypothetical protein Q8N14_03795, partial [Candidatus Omnitrophota bacterium]|nr:hypothetical protein [Candidatus Omnitrophota bacterium]
HTVIPRSVRLSEAPSFGKPISVYDKNSVGARRYDELAQEIINPQAVLNNPQADSDIAGGQMTTQLTPARPAGGE